jgi:hypothetical protein
MTRHSEPCSPPTQRSSWRYSASATDGPHQSRKSVHDYYGQHLSISVVANCCYIGPEPDTSLTSAEISIIRCLFVRRSGPDGHARTRLSERQAGPSGRWRRHSGRRDRDLGRPAHCRFRKKLVFDGFDEWSRGYFTSKWSAARRSENTDRVTLFTSFPGGEICQKPPATSM